MRSRRFSAAGDNDGLSLRSSRACFAIVFFVFACAHPQPSTMLSAGGYDEANRDSIVIEASEGTRLAFDISPDGKWIVFDVFGQIFRIPSVGGAAIPVTDAVADVAEDTDPAISPDGKWVAFQGDRPEGRAVWVISANGGKPRKLTGGVIGYASRAEPSWSPDSKSITHLRGDTLYIVELASQAERMVLIDSLPRAGVRRLEWSRDGKSIVFTSGYGTGPILKVGIIGGRVAPLNNGLPAATFAHSPDNTKLAFIATDSAGKRQVWVQHLPNGKPSRLTDHSDLASYRVRWSPDGGSILYSANGKLWRVSIAGGSPVSIPFNGRVAFARKPAHTLTPIAFAEPGSMQTALGFSGLALSPDGKRIAMIALDSLWVWNIGRRPRSIRFAGRTAQRLTWSPDNREVAWSTGEHGGENLDAIEVATGFLRHVTALPGGAVQPIWSPDGANLAFLHRVSAWQYHLKTVPARGAVVADVKSTKDLGLMEWAFFGQEPAWAADSKGLLTWSASGFYSPVSNRYVPVDGPPRVHVQFPAAPSFLQAAADGSVTYIENMALWRSAFSGDSGISSYRSRLTEDAALYSSVSLDGSVLYVSSDGIRLRRANGNTEKIGWPLRFRAPANPPDLLIRNVRIIDGSGRATAVPSDVLLKKGRIAQISGAGKLRVPGRTRTIDGNGRWMIPGLIDLHVHMRNGGDLAGYLASGVMTIRDTGTPISIVADIASSNTAGLIQGPRVVYGGFQFGAGAGTSGEIEQFPSDSAAIERSVSLARSFGAQYVKHRPFSGWAVSAAIIREAHRHGMRVSGHCTHPIPMIVAGIDGREHAGQCFRDTGILYEDVINGIRATGMWVVPTVAFYSDYLKVAEDSAYLQRLDVAPFLTLHQRNSFKEPINAAAFASYGAFTRTIEDNVRKMDAAGVAMGTGSDSYFPTHLHFELAGLVRSGLSPARAIAAATGVASKILGADTEIGTIEEGKLADLILLDGDPLVDIHNTQRISVLIQGGRIIDRATLTRKVTRRDDRAAIAR